MSKDTESKKRLSSNIEAKTHNKKRKQPAQAPKSTNPFGADGISECFHKVTVKLYVSLAPCYVSNVITGIKSQHLDPLVMTFFPKANGVILSYFNIKLSEDNLYKDEEGNDIALAKISSESPFAFMWISVDFLVWQPKIGDTIEGYSYMETASHIGLLVHDTFNASIKKNNIPTNWRFIPNQIDEVAETETETTISKNKSFGHWVDENGVQIEGKLKFTVKSIHTTGRVVSVEGTLTTPSSERDALPIFRERRSSLSKHKKFDDNEDVAVTEIPEPKEDEEMPTYTIKGSDDDEDEVVNGSSSDEEESD